MLDVNGLLRGSVGLLKLAAKEEAVETTSGNLVCTNCGMKVTETMATCPKCKQAISLIKRLEGEPGPPQAGTDREVAETPTASVLDRLEKVSSTREAGSYAFLKVARAGNPVFHLRRGQMQQKKGLTLAVLRKLLKKT